MRARLAVPLLAAVGPLTACDPPAPVTVEGNTAPAAMETPWSALASAPIRQAIAEILEAEWVAHFTAEDWEAFGAMYTESAWLMPPDLPRIEGREGIAGYFAGLKAFFESMFGPITAEFAIQEVEHYGHTAVVVAVYEVRAAGDVLADTGHLIKTFVRDGSGWLIHRSIFNSDLEGPAS
jgi:ketosteroid isomerase-like protein